MAMYILRSPKEGETLGRLSLGLTPQGQLWRVGERLREPQALVGSLSWCYTYFSSASPSPPLESRLSHLLPEKKDEGQTTQMLKKQRTSQPWCVEEDLRTLLKNKQTSNSGDWRLKCCHAGSLPLGRDAEPGLRWQQLKISQSGEGRRQGWATRNHDQGSPSRFQHRQRKAGGLGLLQPCPWAVHRELDSSSGPGRSLHHVPHTPRSHRHATTWSCSAHSWQLAVAAGRALPGWWQEGATWPGVRGGGKRSQGTPPQLHDFADPRPHRV